MNPIGHLKTISKHKWEVMKNCFRIGMYRQGICHDLSKYSPMEFWTGARYYQGTRSPNAEERDQTGMSQAWLHHKGRNKHHFEYWIDYSPMPVDEICGMKMPLPYVLEMVCDRIAASKIYKGKDYTDAEPYAYYARSHHHYIIHPETDALLESLLRKLRDEGEERTFSHMRRLLGEYRRNKVAAMLPEKYRERVLRLRRKSR